MSHRRTPEEQWSKQKEKLKLMFPQLHDEDFQYDYGMKDIMITKLHSKIGKSRIEFDDLIIGL